MFCYFVDKWKYRNNSKYDNKQSEMQKTKSPQILREFSQYFIIEILGMPKIFVNKLSFTGAGFLNLFVLQFAKQIRIKGCKKPIAYHCYTTKKQFAFIDAIIW